MRSTVPREVDVLAGYDEYFEDLEDPRAASKTRHPLSTVVMIALLGTLCGAESWVDLADFAEAKQSFLATFLDLSEGVPGKDTFRRVFEALSPHAFRRCFQRWIGAVVGTLAGKHLAIDGKTLRGALAHRDAPPLHLVHAWVVDNQALFTQMAGEGKGRELDALLPLFSLLDLRGSTVTIDALGCQREVAEQLVAQKAEYLLSVKDNQPTLHAEARQLLQEARDAGLSDVPDAHARTEERGHGRHEVRAAWVVNDVSACPPASTWPGAKSLVLVERTRTRGEETETEAQVYISSVKDLSAAAALRLIRNHWSVENGLHWTLDVAFREDHSRTHSENGARNFFVDSPHRAPRAQTRHARQARDSWQAEELRMGSRLPALDSAPRDAARRGRDHVVASARPPRWLAHQRKDHHARTRREGKRSTLDMAAMSSSCAENVVRSP